jgi:hypothetical protein
MLLALLISVSAFAGDSLKDSPGTMGEFTFTLSGYIGSTKKCGTTGGGPTSCCNFGNPQDWATEDGKSRPGQEVGLAVSKKMRKYMGCRVSIPDYGENFRIMDRCPHCDKTSPAEPYGRIDISFKDTACHYLKNTFGVKLNVSRIKVHTDDCKKGTVVEHRGEVSAKRKLVTKKKK